MTFLASTFMNRAEFKNVSLGSKENHPAIGKYFNKQWIGT